MTDADRTPSGTDLPLIAALLRAGEATVRAELTAAGDRLCRWRPADGEWSLNEVLGHLVEAERRGFNGRIRTLLAENEPVLAAWDQEVVARERRDAERPTAELLAELAALRADSLQLIAGLRPEQLERGGEYPRIGRLTVRDLLHEWAHHDREHVRQMLAVTQAYVWPLMGNARRFAELD